MKAFYLEEVLAPNFSTYKSLNFKQKRAKTKTRTMLIDSIGAQQNISKKNKKSLRTKLKHFSVQQIDANEITLILMFLKLILCGFQPMWSLDLTDKSKRLFREVEPDSNLRLSDMTWLSRLMT